MGFWKKRWLHKFNWHCICTENFQIWLKSVLFLVVNFQVFRCECKRKSGSTNQLYIKLGWFQSGLLNLVTRYIPPLHEIKPSLVTSLTKDQSTYLNTTLYLRPAKGLTPYLSALDFCNSPVWNIKFDELDFSACCSL